MQITKAEKRQAHECYDALRTAAFGVDPDVFPLALALVRLLAEQIAHPGQDVSGDETRIENMVGLIRAGVRATRDAQQAGSSTARH
jgi:hypothetical protein